MNKRIRFMVGKLALLLLVLIMLILSVPSVSHATSDSDILLANLEVWFNSHYTGKKTAGVYMAKALFDEGYEPAFVAGVVANIIKEGSPGKFENISGYTQKRLLEVFPSLTPVSAGTHKNYIAHMQGFTTYDGCGHDHSEYSTYSNKYLYNGFSLSAVASMVKEYQNESWHAKFGLGSIQWTGGRTATLMKYYLAETDKDTITLEECIHAEQKYMIAELKSSSYKSVYSGWEHINNSDGAYDAAYRFCTLYERPASAKTKGEERGELARDIWAGMTTNTKRTTVRFDSVGGNEVSPASIEYLYGSTMNENAPIPEKVESCFMGWFDADGINVFDRHGYCSNAAEYWKNGTWISTASKLTLTAHWLSFCGEGALALPKELQEVAADAFRGTISINTLSIPETCVQINSGAFAETTFLNAVRFLNGNCRIAEDAFENSGLQYVVAPLDSSVAHWAEQNGYTLIDIN